MLRPSFYAGITVEVQESRRSSLGEPADLGSIREFFCTLHLFLYGCDVLKVLDELRKLKVVP